MRRRTSADCSKTSKPHTRTVPEVAGRNPVMTRRVVVLPAPFGPRKPRISPGWAVKERSWTAARSPYRLLRFATSIMCNRVRRWCREENSGALLSIPTPEVKDRARACPLMPTANRRAPRLHLIDGSGYVYRAFHALPALNTSLGILTNAVLGYANMLPKLLLEEGPYHVAVVFDAPGGTFRDVLYASYKETRGPMPDELRPQIPYIRRLVTALRLPVIEEAG